jgi:hypothetical protein
LTPFYPEHRKEGASPVENAMLRKIVEKYSKTLKNSLLNSVDRPGWQKLMFCYQQLINRRLPLNQLKTPNIPLLVQKLPSRYLKLKVDVPLPCFF